MAKQHSIGYTILFAGLICALCGAVVSSSAVMLQERQEINKVIDRQKQVLLVLGLIQADGQYSNKEINELFTKHIRPVVIDRKTGKIAQDISDPAAFDQAEAAANPATSIEAPPNESKVFRLPNNLQVFHQMEGEQVKAIILPIRGYGLWSTLYGFLALEPDTTTVKGITFYEHGETPGLGGEVDNPNWKAKWPGRKVYNEQWEPTIALAKGQVGPPKEAPHRVDGLSGATLTSNGVTNLLHFWLGEHGFGPYLQHFRKTHGQDQGSAVAMIRNDSQRQ